MGRDSNLISWGVPGLSASFPKPATGRTLLLEGAKKYSHNLVSEMICDEICSGRPIHWIDGGMALDPSGLIPMLSKRGRPPDELRLLRGCRAFTAHQMVDLVRRARGDIRPREGESEIRLVVITDLASMFGDMQVKRAEGKSMLSESLGLIKSLSRTQNVLVVMTMPVPRDCDPYKPLYAQMNDHADDKVSVPFYDGTNIVATHHSLQVSASSIQTLSTRVSLRDFYGTSHSSKVVCMRPPLDNVSSETPNGESIEKEARRASAS
jgi:hypothetical protein